MAEFKDILKMLRKEKKLTQMKLGEMLNYGYTAIANYESGRNQPGIADLKKIASIFDVSLDYLLGVNDIRRPYILDDDSETLNQFQSYYMQLPTKVREELLLYMRLRVQYEQQKHEQTAATMALHVAQDEVEYEKDE